MLSLVTYVTGMTGISSCFLLCSEDLSERITFFLLWLGVVFVVGDIQYSEQIGVHMIRFDAFFKKKIKKLLYVLP